MSDETKYMFFFIKDDELLEKYNKIWEKAKNSIKKEFDSKPVYNEKYLKAKIKSYNGKIICLSVILIYSGSITSQYYYPQVFLEEIKYVVKKEMPEYILAT